MLFSAFLVVASIAAVGYWSAAAAPRRSWSSVPVPAETGWSRYESAAAAASNSL